MARKSEQITLDKQGPTLIGLIEVIEQVNNQPHFKSGPIWSDYLKISDVI
ncbi:hypothetical protein [Lapidilactobacillus luobeiensis]|nr:hypothetical protein [Lapidilactobacillus luobeiensis]